MVFFVDGLFVGCVGEVWNGGLDNVFEGIVFGYYIDSFVVCFSKFE